MLGLAMMALIAPTAHADRSMAAREHRSVWISPYLSGNWPSSSFSNETSVANQKRIIENRMAKFKEQNINIVYFHVRAMADANYKSSYEPWASQSAGKRGGTPAGDPLQTIIDAAHANGIEVYAWVNPYRYSSSGLYGDGELNYETTHHDWLCISGKNVILNPGKKEVTQRIVDVISEVVTNYDVDGVLFDDYFYTSGMSTALDAKEYAEYTAEAGDGAMSQADWRRSNVNNMVHSVNSAIKSIKPYVAFGISPAGVACPPDVTTTHGLPEISGDWQYKGIFSDPLAWLAAGDLDYMSPQIYWPNRWDELETWWARATQKYNRHLYSSVDITGFTTGATTEYMREALDARDKNPADCSGFVFFDYAALIDNYDNVYDKKRPMSENFSMGVFTKKALTPLRPWNNVVAPVMTANVTREGSTLKWDNVESMRYTVYAVPEGTEADFACQREFLDGVSYTNSYQIPSEKQAGYKWAVAVYDRYGNEYSPLFEGATATQLEAPVIVSPAEGGRMSFTGTFKWQSTGNRFIIEVARDAAFSDKVGYIEGSGKEASVTDLAPLNVGDTYYWRVRAMAPNKAEAVSEPSSFVATGFNITSPANGTSNLSYKDLTITCDDGGTGTAYKFIVSEVASLANPVFTAEVNTPSVTIPNRVLQSGKKYYVSVTATNATSATTAETIEISTADRTDYEAPKFVIPSAQTGTTVYSDQAITVEPWEGMRNVKIMLATTTSFPARTSLSITLSDYATATKEAGTLKISSKNLVDGTTYYVRNQGTYSILGSTSGGTTDWSPVYEFTYSSEAGVDNIDADAHVAIYVDGDGILHFGDDTTSVEVYTTAGVTVATYQTAGAQAISLAHLAPGAYLIKVTAPRPVTLKWLK